MVAVVGRDAEVDDLRGSEILDEGAADDPSELNLVQLFNNL